VVGTARAAWAGLALVLAFGVASVSPLSAAAVTQRATTAVCLDAHATIVGTRGDDHLVGTNGPDVIVGGRGNDTIRGLGGDDLICGRSGDDVIIGGSGDDQILGFRGQDRIMGGLGDDRVLGGPQSDRLLGDAGDDRLNGGPASDHCDGGSGANILVSCEDTPNDPPVAADDTATGNEDSPTTVSVLANDSDANGDGLDVSSVNGAGTHGTVAVAPGGSGVTYDPHGQFDALKPGDSGTDSFAYTVSDGHGGTDIATVAVTVTGVDDSPKAVADNKTVAEDAAATTIDVRANDTDVDAGPRTITGVTQPTDGNVVITNSGDDLTYAPDADYCNSPPPSDDFTYTLNGGSVGHVSVTVTCVNDAPVVDLNGSAGGSDVARGFTEDGGAVDVAPAGDVTDVDAGNLASATITLTNHPDGSAESLSVATAGTSITAGTYNSGTGVLTLTGSDAVGHYQQVLRSLKYNNTSNTPGTADRVINVKVNDGAVESNEPHSTMSVTAHNDAPTATDQNASTNEDTGLPITVAGTDPESDALTFTHDATSTHGGTITGPGANLTYQPAADYCGPDSFGFTADDSHGGTDTGTVLITVTCVNDAPVVDLNGTGNAGFDVSRGFTEDSGPADVAPAADLIDVDDTNLESATITLTNHPDGAAESLSVDISGTSITASSYNSGTGVLTLTGSDTKAHYQQVIRSLKYANTSNTPGTTDRSVNVKVTDGDVDSNEPHSTVSVTAHNDAPTATDQSGLSTNEDTGLPITLAGTDPENDPLTFASDQPAHGSVSPTTGSAVTYTPALNYCGPDSFTFHTNDGTVDSTNATVSITMDCVNDAPVVDLNGTGNAGFGTSASFTEDSGPAAVAPDTDLTDVDDTNLESATITLTNHPDGASESLSVVTAGTNITAIAYATGTGVLALTGSDTVAHYQQVIRSLKYTNTSNIPGTADRLIDVKVNDGSLDSNEPHSTVSVAAHNDAPTADNQSGLTTNEDTALPITLTGADAENDPLTYPHDSTSANGGTISGAGPSVAYTPAADYCGPDSFKFHTNDGTADSADATVSITVDCVNDAPVLDLNGSDPGSGNTVTFFEQVSHTGGAVPLAPNGTVVDVDDSNVESLTVTLTNRPDGTNEVLTADAGTTGLTVDAYNTTTGVLLIHGTASKADYQSVLRTVSYRNDATLPNSTTRDVTFVANDGDLDSATETAHVAVHPINVPPVVDLDGGAPPFDTTASFTEDSGPATLAPSATVSDFDNANLSSATITLTSRPEGGAESLSANVAGTSITADAYVPATGVLFLHGSDTKANYQQVLRTVAYNNTSDRPTTTNRSVSFKVNDGLDDSNTATADVSVTATNDPPTATDQSVSTNEDTAKPITLSGTDPENDTLAFTFDSTSAHGGTIAGPAPSVTYTPAVDYCGPDSFNFTADDGNGGTDQGTITITVTCVNDPPVVDLNGGPAPIDNNAAFTEDQPAVILATSATVTDVDNANLSSATVVLTNHPDDAAEGLTAVTTGTSITADAYDTSTGVLFLHGSDTKANYQQVLRSIAYNNTSNTPNTTNRDITWKVNDGSLDSATAHTTLSVTSANDAPTLDLNGGDAGVNETASYTEDQPATTLAPNALATDPDDVNLESATVTLTNHPDGAAESLSVDTTGTSITAVAYNGGTGVLSLSGSDTVASYQQVLRTVKYLNTSQNANTTNRVVNFVANDGSANSNSPTATVTIVVVNDPPVVDMNGGGGGDGIDSAAAFVEDSSPNVVGSGPVNLGASATVSDVDNASLASATLTLTDRPNGGNESLSVTIPGGSPITTGGYNSSTGVLTLTGPATLAQFQTVIQSAKYNNTSNTPDPTNRDVTTKVNDGAADSTVAHTTVSVTPTNDAPVAVDETFNGTSSAVGNTTLSVNDTNNHGGTADGRMATPDPTDLSPVTDRPHKEITGDIIGNDADPESANSALTITAGTFQTKNASTNANDGGSVTVEADGDFLFEPPPGCPAVNSYFDYTVHDNAGTNPGTDTGRVTIASAGCVWYVNNNDADGNSGTSEKPFSTLAQAQTASANGNSIYVYYGDGTTVGDTAGSQTAGIDLKPTQKLVGQASDLVVGTDTLQPAYPAKRPVISDSASDVVVLDDGNLVSGIEIDPSAASGGGIAGVSGDANGSDASGTIDNVKVIDDDGTNGGQAGLDLDGSTGTWDISNLIVQTVGGATGVHLNNAGTVRFASAGTISITSAGGKALGASAVSPGITNMGTGANKSVFDDLTSTGSNAGGVSLIGTSGETDLGDGSGTDLNLHTISGSTPALEISNGGTVTVPASGTSNVEAIGATSTSDIGPAVYIQSTPGAIIALDDVDSTNSSGSGINIDSIGVGTFTANSSSTITSADGVAFDVNGGSGDITFAGAIDNGEGSTAEVTNRTAGTVTLSGPISDSGDSTGSVQSGVSLSGNTGGFTVLSNATKTFTMGEDNAIVMTNSDGHTLSLTGGGLVISTTTGKGLEATTSGTINVTGSGNTIDTTTGRALNIDATEIGSNDLTFRKVSSNAAPNGIRLNSTGPGAGDLTVTGDPGGLCGGAVNTGTVPATTTAPNNSDCTGGSIVNSVGAGVELTNVPGSVSLTHVRVTSGQDDGIRATTVGGGVDLVNSQVSSNGNAATENGLEFQDVTGNSVISGTTVSGSGYHNANLRNTSSGTADVDVIGSTFSAPQVATGSSGLLMTGGGSAELNADVTGSLFNASRDVGFLVTSAPGAPQIDVNFLNNDIVGDPANAVPASPGLSVGTGDASDVRVLIQNNDIINSLGKGLVLNPIPNSTTAASFDATVTNNRIGSASADSGSGTSNAVDITGAGSGVTRMAITNNTIQHWQINALRIDSGEKEVVNPVGSPTNSVGSADFVVQGNTMSSPDSGSADTMQINVGVQSGAAAQNVCADIGGSGGGLSNAFGGQHGVNGGDFDLQISERFQGNLRFPGFVGDGSVEADIQTFIRSRNTGNPTVALIDNAISGGASCATPSLPPAVTP
jgi:hypothetical protein